MGYQQIVPPDAEPVPLEDLRDFLRIDGTDSDTLIQSLALAARAWCENYTERYFVTQTWRIYLDAFPGYIDARSEMARSITQVPTGAWFLIGTRWAFALPFPPCTEVVQLQYLDSNNLTQTMVQGVQYVIDIISQPARVMPAYGLFWPVSRFVPNAVWCDFVCGYGEPAEVPELIKTAIKVLTLHFYDNRGVSDEIPTAVTALLSSFVDRRF